ncbi:hypothetical protein A4X13_0g2102 [Tilletia indica]|uniref:Uncharacterized protein n=1 Tax=Tilletia indica TaxID=43049 RepID=A0A177TBI1_9BASI|nr:hypothetical protein A4X13_0g2102 [Tilletia indica]
MHHIYPHARPAPTSTNTHYHTKSTQEDTIKTRRRHRQYLAVRHAPSTSPLSNALCLARVPLLKTRSQARQVSHRLEPGHLQLFTYAWTYRYGGRTHAVRRPNFKRHQASALQQTAPVFTTYTQTPTTHTQTTIYTNNTYPQHIPPTHLRTHSPFPPSRKFPPLCLFLLTSAIASQRSRAYVSALLTSSLPA